MLQAGPAAADTVTLHPTQDTWVSSDAPDTPHGLDTTLQIGGYLSNTDPDRRAYLRFEQELPPGAIATRTTLRLFFDSAPSGGFQLRITNPQKLAWDEGAATWNTPPNTPPNFTGPVSGATGTIKQGWNAISVPFVPDNISVDPARGAITYVLTRPGTETATLQSDEGTVRPELVVEYETPDNVPTSVCSASGCVESTPWTISMSWA